MKTDYPGVHEAEYRKRRAQGASGYNSPELYQDTLRKVQDVLTAYGVTTGRVLELGCGAGNLSLLLAGRGFRCFGIDISPTAIEWAQEKSRESGHVADFRVGSALALPYEDQSFDIVLDALCWHCIIGDDRPIFLNNAFRVLRSQGLFIVMTKCGEPKEESYPFDPVTRCRIDNGVATRYWGTPDGLIHELESAGFNLLKHRVYDDYRQDLFFAVATHD